LCAKERIFVCKREDLCVQKRGSLCAKERIFVYKLDSFVGFIGDEQLYAQECYDCTVH
jgi:hypothetical protein